MTTTWSPTDKSATATLSGGNLVVTFGGGSPGIRSADRVYTGKYYWENTFTTTANALIGICNGTVSLTSLNSGTAGSQCITLIFNGSVFNNGNINLGSIGGTTTNGWIACIALDATSRLIWFRNGAAGNWNGNVSANPATGVGGYDISIWLPLLGLTGLYACANGGGGGGVITANFGASGFTGAVPSGFTSGFPDSTTLITSEVATQIAAEHWAKITPPDARATQVAVEHWVTTNVTNPQMAVTNVALEHWAAVAAASSGAQARAAILA